MLKLIFDNSHMQKGQVVIQNSYERFRNNGGMRMKVTENVRGRVRNYSSTQVSVVHNCSFEGVLERCALVVNCDTMRPQLKIEYTAFPRWTVSFCLNMSPFLSYN